MTKNVFTVPERLDNGEVCTPLAAATGFRVERIVSWGEVTPEGAWYDQDHDEWVIVVQGEGAVEDDKGTRTVLKAGEWLFLPAHLRHRVVYTSQAPPCIWLAVHGEGTGQQS